jgi:hypothetical protein
VRTEDSDEETEESCGQNAFVGRWSRRCGHHRCCCPSLLGRSTSRTGGRGFVDLLATSCAIHHGGNCHSPSRRFRQRQ